jgi:hypothetical protein
MKKTTAVLCIVAALLVGVAVTVYAQITWVTVSVKYDNTTTYPVLGNSTQWVYVWHAVADSKGIAYGSCDAACRRAIVGERMREEFNNWLGTRVKDTKTAAAEAEAIAIAGTLNGTVD